jgi:CHAT domain-containing protein/Tfp pilus assembly protein PilF
MTSQAIRQSLALLLALCFWCSAVAASHFQSADEAAIGALIERYFAAYATEDLDAITQMWSARSGDFAPLKSRLQNLFSLNDKIAVGNPQVRQLVVEGERASALVSIEMSAIDTKTGKPATGLGRQNRALSFAREAGVWKIWREVSAEEELALRLTAAKDAAERQAALESQPEFRNLALRQALTAQGLALRSKGLLPQSLAIFELAQRIAEQINDQSGIAETWNDIAFLHLMQGNPTLALERYQKAQALCEPSGNKGCLATALTGIGNAYRFKGNADLGIDYMKRGLALSEEAGEPGRRAAILNSLGAAYDSQNQYLEALNYYQEGLRVYESLGEKARSAVLLNNIGVAYNSLGDLDMAIEYLQKSIAMDESLGNRNSLAEGFTNIGVSYSLRGDYSSAMNYFQKGLAVFEGLNNKRSAAASYVNIANVHLAQGNLDLALEYQQKSLAIREAQQDKGEIAGTLNNMGLIYVKKGDTARALEAYQRSLSMSETLKDRSRIARVLTNLGTFYSLQGNYPLALEHYQKGLQLREVLREKGGIAKLLGNIGMVYGLQGDHGRAAEYAERAITLAREGGARAELADALTTAGSAYQGLGQTAKAGEAFREAIATTEALRLDAGGGEQEQQQVFERKVSPYYRMLEMLAAKGEAGEALAYAERAKARVLVDVLRSGRVNIAKAMTNGEKAEEQTIRASLVSLNTQLSRENRRSQPDQARLAQLKTELDRARLGYQDFQSRLYAAHPSLKVRRGAAPVLTLKEAGELAKDSKTALLEYAVADEKTYLFALTINTATPNRPQEPTLRLYELKIRRPELAEKVQRLRDRIANNDLDYAALASELYTLLVAPARQQLAGKTNLVIVPDDILWETPFQALRAADGRFLIQQASVSYAPSLTVLREISKLRKPKSAPTLLAMGNPKLTETTVSRSKNVLMSGSFEALPEAERLVKELAQVYGVKSSKVFVGAEAREEVLKAESNKYRILQLATHGVINNASPMYSHIVLAASSEAKEDGLLEAWEIMQMDLQADLAVLSACETARGRIGAGEGVIGLSWALFVAECPTTVVSQWKVESTSTTELMLQFHRRLQAGMTKSEALRQAALKLMADKRLNHPFYWAGFIVVGDGN